MTRDWRKIGTYLALTLGLSAIFYWQIITAGKLGAHGGLWVYLLMWSPGTAGMLTQLLWERNLYGFGWRWNTKYNLWGYAIPLLYAAAAYGVVWAAGWGSFPDPEFVARLVKRYGGPESAAILAYVARAATLGVALSCTSALGEEIGWRGFLVPHLARVLPFRAVALVSGIIWSMWHYPILLFAGYNGGTPAWFSLSCFTVAIVSESVIFAWLRLESGSVWPAMMLHASHNLFIQGVFTPLTHDTGNTKWFIDEFGIAVPLTSILAAIWFLRARKPGNTA